ncbi:hypothetical protein MMC24_003527 [Lignoscripta atroalba]|nr:hypothetical protein [Lignoscripta atroalba]
MRPLRLLRQTASPFTRNGSHPPQRAFNTLRRQPLPQHHSPLLNFFSNPTSRQPQLFRQLLSRRFNSTKPSYNPTPHLNAPPPTPSLSLSQRLRKLSREYGWSAVGVYFLLTAIDFPFCFIAVRLLGTDRIGHWEHVIVEWFWRAFPLRIPALEGRSGSGDGETQAVGVPGTGRKVEEYGVVEGGSGSEVGVPGYDHGVKEAEKRNKSENASIWTQLALAYAIHKSFIFIRVPLTAALTPKVVKVLRGWGWDIGKRKPKGKISAPGNTSSPSSSARKD